MELNKCRECGAAEPKFAMAAGYQIVTCVECDHSEHLDEWQAPRPIEDALRARVAELEAAQRWISAEDELPEPLENGCSDYVLGVVNGYSMIFCWVEHSEEGPRWFTHTGSWNNVTHWMPLPAPPSAEEGGDDADQD